MEKLFLNLGCTQLNFSAFKMHHFLCLTCCGLHVLSSFSSNAGNLVCPQGPVATNTINLVQRNVVREWGYCEGGIMQASSVFISTHHIYLGRRLIVLRNETAKLFVLMFVVDNAGSR